jgi:hypothetical protein
VIVLVHGRVDNAAGDDEPRRPGGEVGERHLLGVVLLEWEAGECELFHCCKPLSLSLSLCLSLSSSEALTLWKLALEDVYEEWSWRLQLLYLPPLDIPRDGMEMTRNREDQRKGYGLI